MCLPRPETDSGRTFDDLMDVPTNNGSEPVSGPLDKDSCDFDCLTVQTEHNNDCSKVSGPIQIDGNDSCLESLVSESPFGSEGIPSVSSLKLENISDNFADLDSQSDSSSSLSDDAKNSGYCLRPRKSIF